jgi:general secretion pathway protein J
MLPLFTSHCPRHQRRGPKYSQRSVMQGFSLIEVMVALVIFVALSFGVYQVLNQVQRSEQLTRDSSSRLNQLQKAVLIIDSDMRQIASRAVRTNGENPNKHWLLWQDYLLDSDSKGLLFTRLGWSNLNQQFPRGEVVKVGYRLVGKQLQRIRWRYPDSVAGDQGVVTPILDGVSAISARFLNQQEWLDSWDRVDALPEAISLTLTLEDYGDVTRIYMIASTPTIESNTAASNE